jgi:hypothetical protein
MLVQYSTVGAKMVHAFLQKGTGGPVGQLQGVGGFYLYFRYKCQLHYDNNLTEGGDE